MTSIRSKWTDFRRTVAVVALLGIAPAGAHAGGMLITPTDLDTVILGDLVAGPLDSTFESMGGGDVGFLTGTVYLLDDLYTYTLQVTANTDFVSEFNTAFEVAGFNGVAGYSFSESAETIGGVGDDTDWTIAQDNDGTLDYFDLVSFGLRDGEVLTFFYQSRLGPTLGDYNLIDGDVGTTTNLAPVPLPGAALLFGSSLLGLGLVRRRRRS